MACERSYWDPTVKVGDPRGHVVDSDRAAQRDQARTQSVLGPESIALGDEAGPKPVDSVQRGTGTFVRQVTGPSVDVSPGDVTLNFDGTDIREVVKVILGDLLQVNYVLHPAVQGVASLETGQAKKEIPVPAMLFETPERVRERAAALAARIRETLAEPAPQVMVEEADAAVGGGTLPPEGLRSSGVVIDPRPHGKAARLERALRHVRPALLGRIQDERVLLDPRTVSATEEGLIPGLVREAWAAAVAPGA